MKDDLEKMQHGNSEISIAFTGLKTLYVQALAEIQDRDSELFLSINSVLGGPDEELNLCFDFCEKLQKSVAFIDSSGLTEKYLQLSKHLNTHLEGENLKIALRFCSGFIDFILLLSQFHEGDLENHKFARKVKGQDLLIEILARSKSDWGAFLDLVYDYDEDLFEFLSSLYSIDSNEVKFDLGLIKVFKSFCENINNADLFDATHVMWRDRYNYFDEKEMIVFLGIFSKFRNTAHTLTMFD